MVKERRASLDGSFLFITDPGRDWVSPLETTWERADVQLSLHNPHRRKRMKSAENVGGPFVMKYQKYLSITKMLVQGHLDHWNTFTVDRWSQLGPGMLMF
jgi:hypothetical protein